MQEMNYQPNELARSLAKAHSNTIGVIVPHISHPFFSKMISALESAAAKRGYKILLCNSKDQPEKETEYLDMFISCIACVTFFLVSSLMYPRLLITRETVVAVTPARAAMSLIVAMFLSSSFSNCFSLSLIIAQKICFR